MQRTCTEDDWEHWPNRPPEAPCGATYDDVDHSTICPHDPLPPKLSIEDLQTLASQHQIDIEGTMP